MVHRPHRLFVYTVPHAGVRVGFPTVAPHGALWPRVSMQPALKTACGTV